MRSSDGYLGRVTVVGGCLGLVALVFLLCSAGILITQKREQTPRAPEPPVVIVTHPISGTWPYAGTLLSVSATAFGPTSPITRAELWVDGTLKETEPSPLPSGVERLAANFDLWVTEGPHMIFVRAFNAAGMSGQSLPLSFVARAKDPSQRINTIAAHPGETIAGIAEDSGIDRATFQALNPAQGNGPLPGGTLLILPQSIEPDQGAPSAPAEASAPPGSSPLEMPAVAPLEAVDPSKFLGLDVNFVLGLFVTRLPAAPSDLQAQVADCRIKLRWNDMATNEDRYEVWMAGMGLPPSKLATLKPSAGDTTWYEFSAPQPGYFSLWVEAVNAVGNQASNIVWVQVASTCATTIGDQLRIDLLDISVGTSVDKAYCYVAFGDAPGIRLPEHDFTFIPVNAGQGDLGAQPRSFTVPTPSSGALNISGECWGWSGKSLHHLGTESQGYGAETWTGARQVLGKSFQVGFTIKPLGTTDTRDPTGWRSPGDPPTDSSGNGFIPEYVEDPTLPVPYGLSLEDPKLDCAMDSTPSGGTRFLKCKTLRWKLGGDQSKITGFLIFSDENGPFRTAKGGSIREALVTPWEFRCAGIKWQVAAVAGGARSKLSDPIEQPGPASCRVYAKVKFLSIIAHYNCDLDMYFKLNFRVQDYEATRWFYGYGALGERPWTGYSFTRLRCGPNSFKEIIDDNPFSLVDWSGLTTKPYSEFEFALPGEAKDYANAPFTVWVRANFAERHDWKSDDVIGKFNDRYDFESLAAATKLLGCGETFNSKSEGTLHGYPILVYEMTIYPNECGDVPYPQK